MSELVPFLVIGIVTGAVYGLAGVGLVLTYKISGVFNFAHGALAAVAAYAFYELQVQQDLPWPVAAIITVLVVGPLMGLVMELLARRIQGTALALRVAATVGVLLIVEAAAILHYGTTELREVPVFLTSADFKLGSTTIQWSDVITFLFALLATVALSMAFRATRRGLAMRAVVDNPDLLDLRGTSPVVTRRVGWIIGSSFAAASGVLFAPLLPLDPVQLTLLVVAAFGAAALGAFRNLLLTFVGGVAIGVLASLCTKWFPEGILSGLPPAMPFVVLFIVLLAFPKRYLAGASFTVPRSRPLWSAPPRFQLGAGLVLIAVLLFVPSFSGIHQTDFTVALGMFIVFLSLVLLVRTSGQVSLGHVAFMAIGAAGFSHLAVGSGLPWFLALLVAGLIAVPVGAVLAIPAIRLGGLYLALATFGFGVVLQTMFYTQDFMFGSSGTGLEMPRPSLFESDNAYYYLVLTLAVLSAGVVVALTRGRLGRLLRAMSDSPTALETTGTAVNTTRVIVFCLSAFLAAVGGAVAGVAQTTVTADPYFPLLSLTFFVLVMIVVGSEPWAAALAAFGWSIIPSYVTGEKTTTVLQLLFGVFAVLVAIAPTPEVPAAVRTRLDGLFRRGGKRVKAPAPADITRVESTELVVEDLTIRFGGLVAVDGFSLRAPTGSITGLIGPNGAGKTTTFNACSGLVKPSGGRVLLGREDVTSSGPAARARMGLGRTFQKVELLDSLTVRENVAIGIEGGFAGVNPTAHLAATPDQRRLIAARTEDALQRCDLLELADTPANALSTGQRRLVELARCLAGDSRILLLDEPSSGLDRVETQRFGEILKEVVAERGVGILLVEHDMALVSDICERVHVLDFGKKIYEGAPADAMVAPAVRAAYLGDADLEDIVAETQPTTGAEVGR